MTVTQWILGNAYRCGMRVNLHIDGEHEAIIMIGKDGPANKTIHMYGDCEVFSAVPSKGDWILEISNPEITIYGSIDESLIGEKHV